MSGAREYFTIMACSIVLGFALTYAGVPQGLIPPIIYSCAAVYVVVLLARLAIEIVWSQVESAVWYAFADCWDGR